MKSNQINEHPWRYQIEGPFPTWITHCKWITRIKYLRNIPASLNIKSCLQTHNAHLFLTKLQSQTSHTMIMETVSPLHTLIYTFRLRGEDKN